MTDDDLDRLPVTPKGARRARLALDPLANAAGTVPCYSTNVAGFELGLNELVDELDRQAAAVARGDLTRPEATLVAQATSLDSIFNYLMVQARENLHDRPDASDRYMRLAFRAQNQCRATLGTLMASKNPSTIIAQQANVTSGSQQINNGMSFPAERQFERSKLLGAINGERLDTRATGTAIGADSQLEAVGAINRPEDTRG